MEVVYHRCAGLDVHKESVVACVRIVEGREVKREVRTFGTTTAELLALSAWLAEQGVTHIAMEATGVYWKPVWHILSDGEFVLVLANAAHIKNVPGRKTDVNDATWIAELLAHGLIRASFVPEQPIQELRDLMRTRKQLVREQASHTQRIQKTLEDANIKLDSAISDVLGVSGRAMVEALIAGEDDPVKLAQLAHRKIKASQEDLRAALHGRVTDHHRFFLRLHLRQVDGLQALIGEIDQEVDAHLAPFRTAVEQVPERAGHQGPLRQRDRGGDRHRHEPLPDRRPSAILGWIMSPKQRECRQAPVLAPEERLKLAQDDDGPMRLVGGAHEGHLLPQSVPPAQAPHR